MLEIYLPPCDLGVCVVNDAWFDSNLRRLETNSEVKGIIKRIDGVDYKGAGYITAKFNNGEDVNIVATALSTGCKTALNVLLNPQQIFSVVECGKNALDAIFTLSEGKIFMPYISVVSPFHREVALIGGGSKKIVADHKQYIQLLGRYFDNLGRV